MIENKILFLLLIAHSDKFCHISIKQHEAEKVEL